MPAFDAALVDAAQRSAAWPFEEARKLVARIEKSGKKTVIFETGYGPSGLPHIGTFGEVARTSMVRHAFRVLTGNTIPTRLIAFSDDMDGLRKVPDNVPNREVLAANLGKPLTEVPDPFGTHDSFGRHNNARLRAFLDGFGFDYEFKSSTDAYRAGEFDATLLRMLARYDAVMKIMLPTLREERAATYSPFLPIHPRTRVVMQVPIDEVDVAARTIAWTDPDTKERFVTPVTGGNVKLQWKPDWAMRWVALGVDYEMAGKDLIDSVKVSSQIARALDGTPPEGFNYELFLDIEGKKISKSKGNGLTMDEWLRYGTPESLSWYMFQSPKSAKSLHFNVIPRAIDDYLSFIDQFQTQEPAKRIDNAVWSIHAGDPPKVASPVSFSLLLNLVGVANASSKEQLWAYFAKYLPEATPETEPTLDRLMGHALNYYEDFVKPTKSYRLPTEQEKAALLDLAERLKALPAGTTDGETIQNEVYAVGKAHAFEPLRAWFRALYEVLLGASQGPRFGSFAAIYGLPQTIALIERGANGELAK